MFTLFDPRTPLRVAERVVGSGALQLWDTWRTRQFEYCWLLAAAGKFVDFWTITERALDFAIRAHGVLLAPARRLELMSAYERLELWPDTRSALEGLRSAGLRLAPLANFSTPMIEQLLRRSGIREYFDEVLSTDRVRSYKPEPRAYALAPDVLRLSRAQIAFAAFGAWDAAGASWFGFPTFWVNRLNMPAEDIGPGPDQSGPTLRELALWIQDVTQSPP